MLTFAYFLDVIGEAPLVMEPCYFCGAIPSIDGNWLDFDFEYDAEPPPVCLNDLLAKKAKMDVPQDRREDLARCVTKDHPDWTPQTVQEYCQAKVALLEVTPPVPWIQYNEWPICCSDFTRYRGKLTREGLVAQANYNLSQARDVLVAIFVELRPNWHSDDATNIWNLLGNYFEIYAFLCQNHAENAIYILQAM